MERADYHGSTLLQSVLPRGQIERLHHRRLLALKFVFDVALVHRSNHAKSSPGNVQLRTSRIMDKAQPCQMLVRICHRFERRVVWRSLVPIKTAQASSPSCRASLTHRSRAR